MNKININGAEYPCRVTIGTLKRFKEATGKELSAVGDLFALVELLYMALAESCEKAGVALPYGSAEELMDDIDFTEIEQVTAGLFGGQAKGAAADGKKKRP